MQPSWALEVLTVIAPITDSGRYTLTMTSKQWQWQWQWLMDVAGKIPGLFLVITGGKYDANILLGERVIDGRAVRLSFKTEVMDPGHNPLAGHASASFPTAKLNVPIMASIKPRHRKRPKRW